jgi:hypothetical protein
MKLNKKEKLLVPFVHAVQFIDATCLFEMQNPENGNEAEIQAFGIGSVVWKIL